MKLSNEGGVFSPEETAHKILEDTLVRPHLLLRIHNPQSTVQSPASLSFPFPSPCHHNRYARAPCVQRGQFLSWIGMNGYLLARITAGMTPARSLLDLFVEIFAAPLLRIIALFVVSDFYSKVRRWAPAATQPGAAAASNSGSKKRD